MTKKPARASTYYYEDPEEGRVLDRNAPDFAEFEDLKQIRNEALSTLNNLVERLNELPDILLTHAPQAYAEELISVLSRISLEGPRLRRIATEYSVIEVGLSRAAASRKAGVSEKAVGTWVEKPLKSEW